MKIKISLTVLVALLIILSISLTSCFLLGGDTDGGGSGDGSGDGTGDGSGDGGGQTGGDNPGDGDGDGDQSGGGGSYIPNIDFSGVSFPPVTVDYNGKPHNAEIVGKPGNIYVTTEYEGNGAVDAGVYTVTAKFYFKGEYMEGKDMTTTLTVNRVKFDTHGLSFGDKTVIYNGKTHGAFVRGKLPEGVTAQYSGNGQSEVGEYTVTASFVGESKNYLPLDDMTATLKIVEGPELLGGLSLSDSTVEYNGARHSLVVAGSIPSGVSVKYSIGEKSNAGTYPCDARLIYQGGEFTLSAELTILPRKVTVSAEDLTVSYDGKPHSIELEWGAGDNVSTLIVHEIGNAAVTPGVHNVRFRFEPSEGNSGNFYYVPDVSATLTILEGEVDPTTGLIFEACDGGYAVSGYTGSEKSVNIPDKYIGSDNREKSVVKIKSGAFLGNTNIEYVNIPASVTSIGNKAFSGCTSLREVSIPEGVGVIGSLAFEKTALVDVNLPDSLEAIGQGAFRGASLERISLPFIGGSRITSNKWVGYIFGASAYAAHETYMPKTLKTVVLKDSCTVVYAYSFFECRSVEEIIIGSGVTEIGVSAFQGCTSLIGLYIPTTVKDIPGVAEYYNSPVFACKSGLTIATDAASKQSGWSVRWDIITELERAEKLFGVSYDEYIDAIRASLFCPEE